MKNAAVPTPYGWILVSQRNFDLHEVISFQTQLANLSRSVGSSNTMMPSTDSRATEMLDAGELVPLTAA